ncbi:MAG: ABC transporter ATP-binding protein [Leucobacter sp.]
MDEVLRVRGLKVRYGVVAAVRGIDFSLGRGEVLAIAGANGAGKSSTVMSIVAGTENAVTEGSIRYRGQELVGLAAERISSLGIACVPEGRRIFSGLTVMENLLLGAAVPRRHPDFEPALREVFTTFPILEEFRRRPAGLLSGGQLQQLALGRAMIRRPELMVIDEPSIGLSPNLVSEILAHIAALRDSGTAILLVDQNAERAKALADRWMVIDKGRIRECSWDAAKEVG